MRKLHDEFNEVSKEEKTDLFNAPGMTVNADAFSSVKSPKIASGTRKNSIESLSLSFGSVVRECDE